jgi:hypothetical protein
LAEVVRLAATRFRAFCGRLTFAFLMGRLAERGAGRGFRLLVFFTVRRFAFVARPRALVLARFALVLARLATALTLSYS